MPSQKGAREALGDQPDKIWMDENILSQKLDYSTQSAER